MMLAAPAATAAGAATSDGLPSAPPGAGTGPTAGTGGAREGKRWLAAQGRPGRRFFLAAGLADLAATVGTVILSWYIAALIVAGVVAGGLASRGLAFDVLGVAAGGFLRAAGAFAADRLAAAGAAGAEASARDAVLDALVLGDPADEQVSAGAAVAAVSEQLPRLGDHFHDYQRRAVTACLASAVILAVIFPVSWVVGVLLALATPIVPVNMAVTGLGAEAVSRRQMHQVAQLSGQVLERLQAMSTLRALGAIGHQRRLVERAATELAHRTAAVLRVAFLASSALEWVSTFAIGLVAMYVGATLLGYFRVPLLPVHLGAQAGVFVLLLAPAYFAPLRRFAAAYHQRQEALAAAEILAPLSRRAATDSGPRDAAAPGPGTAGRRLAPTSSPARSGAALQGVRAPGRHGPLRGPPAARARRRQRLRAAANRPRRHRSLGIGEVHPAQSRRRLAAAQRRPRAHRRGTRRRDRPSAADRPASLPVFRHPGRQHRPRPARRLPLPHLGGDRGRAAHQPARPGSPTASTPCSGSGDGVSRAARPSGWPWPGRS